MDVREEAVQKKLELGGFLTTGTKYPLKNAHDLSVAYTPGVAEPCLRIKEKEELSFDLTCRGNMVAVISDGTRVLGLGDIGAAAAMPVMEGKSLLFKRFGNVDCVPVVIDTKDKVGVIAELSQIFTERGVNIISILSRTLAGDEREVTIRADLTQAMDIVERIRDAGYDIKEVSTLRVEAGHEG